MPILNTARDAASRAASTARSRASEVADRVRSDPDEEDRLERQKRLSEAREATRERERDQPEERVERSQQRLEKRRETSEEAARRERDNREREPVRRPGGDEAERSRTRELLRKARLNRAADRGSKAAKAKIAAEKVVKGFQSIQETARDSGIAQRNGGGQVVGDDVNAEDIGPEPLGPVEEQDQRRLRRDRQRPEGPVDRRPRDRSEDRRADGGTQAQGQPAVEAASDATTDPDQAAAVEAAADATTDTSQAAAVEAAASGPVAAGSSAPVSQSGESVDPEAIRETADVTTSEREAAAVRDASKAGVTADAPDARQRVVSGAAIEADEGASSPESTVSPDQAAALEDSAQVRVPADADAEQRQAIREAVAGRNPTIEPDEVEVQLVENIATPPIAPEWVENRVDSSDQALVDVEEDDLEDIPTVPPNGVPTAEGSRSVRVDDDELASEVDTVETVQQVDLGDDVVPDSIEDPISGAADWWDDQASLGSDLLVPDTPIEDVTDALPGVDRVDVPGIGGKNPYSAVGESAYRGIARGANPAAALSAVVEGVETGVYAARGIDAGDLDRRLGTIGEQGTLLGRSAAKSASQDPVAFAGTVAGGAALEGAAVNAVRAGARAGLGAGRPRLDADVRAQLDEFRRDVRGQQDLSDPRSRRTVEDTVAPDDPVQGGGAYPGQSGSFETGQYGGAGSRGSGGPAATPEGFGTDFPADAPGRGPTPTASQVDAGAAGLGTGGSLGSVGAVSLAASEGRQDLVGGVLERQEQAQASSFGAGDSVDAARTATADTLLTREVTGQLAQQSTGNVDGVGDRLTDGLRDRLDDASRPGVRTDPEVRTGVDARPDLGSRVGTRTAVRADQSLRADQRPRVDQRPETGVRTDVRPRPRFGGRPDPDGRSRDRDFDFDLDLPDRRDEEEDLRGNGSPGLLGPYVNPIASGQAVASAQPETGIDFGGFDVGDLGLDLPFSNGGGR